MSENLTGVSSKILSLIQQQFWGNEEKPLVTSHLDFRFNSDKSFMNGYFVLTYGCIYLFKSKMLGSIEFYKTCHIIHLRSLNVAKKELILQYSDNSLILRSPDNISIASQIMRIADEISFSIPKALHIHLDSYVDIPIQKITERSKNSLTNRCLFMAHAYNKNGDGISSLDYFQKWEKNALPMIVFGPHCQLGQYQVAVANAIAWESIIDTVCFQYFQTPGFSKFLSTLLKKSKYLVRLAFTDYREKRVPRFEFNSIKTTVTRYWFLRTCAKLICDFFAEADQILTPMTELVLVMISFMPQQFGDLVTSIANSESASQVRTIFMVSLQLKPFPFNDMSRLVHATQNLNKLVILNIDTDASYLLSSIFSAKTSIKSITIAGMVFRTEMSAFDNIELPPCLSYFNISTCTFSAIVFQSILNLLTFKWHRRAIIFIAQNLTIKPAINQIFKDFDFSNVKANLCEIDWSGNQIPNEILRHFFGFLYTQKRLRMLVFNDISTENPTVFLTYLLQLITNLPLPAIDLCGKFPPAVFTQFISALTTSPFLRRIKLKCDKCGDLAFQALTHLIKVLPNLNEVSIDGFKPQTPQPFFELWKAISEHPSIQSSEIPVEDLKSLGLSLNRLGDEIQSIFKKIGSKLSLSIPDQRLEYTLQKSPINENTDDMSPIELDDDVFQFAPMMEWTENSQDQIEKMSGTVC